VRAFGLCLILVSATLLPASAQVTVEMTMDQDQFLPAEALPVAVRITNRSGRTLRLGREADWLTFAVESRNNEIVPRIGDVPVAEEVVVESSRVATLRADLAPYFLLTRPGRYTVTATVRIKDWNESVRSSPKGFDIIEGGRLWEQEVGVPDSGSATKATPEVRKFILQQANYLKSQLRLYVRLTDASGAKTFRVLPIGPLVSFARPEPQVDMFSNMHLLYQDGPHSFSYTVISPHGEIIARQTYDYVDKRPRLVPDAGGRILVTGGVRRPTPRDVPPYKPPSETNQMTKPGPAPGEMMLPGP
jgi:hypothetical protein